MKKGNLTEAIEEAIELWIKSSEIELLEKIANDPGQLNSVQTDATKTLAKIGYAAIPALTRVARNKGSLTSLQRLALRHIDLILSRRSTI